MLLRKIVLSTKKLYKKKLLFKLMLFLFINVFFITFLSLLYLGLKNSNQLKKELELSVSHMLNYSQIAYSQPLWTLDNDYLNSLSKALLTNNFLIAVNVYNNDNLISTLTKKIDDTGIEYQINDKAFEVPIQSKYIKKVSGIITSQNKKLGYIEIFYTEKYVEKMIRDRILNLIVIFSIIGISLFGIIYFILNRYFVNPIINLADISRKIAKEKDFSLRIERTYQNEIGILYNGFNYMLHNIEKKEIELNKIRNFLNNIIESMPSMLISINENGIVTHWNQAAVEQTNIPATEIVGQNIWEKIDFLGEIKEVYKDIIHSKQPFHIYRKQMNINEDEDSKKLKNIAVYPLVENGLVGLVIRIDDITELEKKEEQLRQAQKMDTIGTLAGGIAHDFNNVLGGIIGTISLLKFKLKNKSNISPEELIGYIDVMEDSGNRASSIVQQILTLSRKKELKFVAVDLNTTLKHVMKICETTFDKKIELIFEYWKGEAFAKADPTQLEQVILNLCVNAYHAMTIMKNDNEKIEGKLNVDIEKVFSDKCFCKSHPEAKEHYYWLINIKDTGVGMDSKTIAKIFDPFFTTKDKGKGTGLGLAMVYNIVQLHKGFIDVYSEVNVGTAFHIYIPALDDNNIQVSEIEEANVIKGEGVILLVDDEEIIRSTALEILKELGYEILLAKDGKEGVNMYKKYQERIDLVILDMVMPKMSGKEAFIEIKKINANAKILMSSGFKFDERVKKVLELGADSFIQKPYTLIKLSKAIYNTLHKGEKK